MKCDYRLTRLEDAAIELSDGLHKAPVFDRDGEYIFVNATNLENGYIVDKDQEKHTSYSEYLKYGVHLTERTILYSIDGTIGNIARYRGEKCVLGKGACYITVKQGISVDYIFYQLQSPHFHSYISSMATGSTIRHISLKTMRNYSFPLPEYSTQEKIVSLLLALDNKIELNNRISENLEQQAASYYYHLFVENADPSWREGTISDFGTVVGGSTPSKAKPEYYTDDGIAWITPKDLSVDKSKFITHGADDITELGLRNSSATIMPAGTVLFSSRAPIGYIAIADGEVTTNQGFKSVVPNDKIGTAFMYYFLKSALPTIESMASGSTFKEISGSTMRTVPAIIPDDDTLREFSSFCEPLFQQQRTLEAENRSLATLRDSLLPRLMSGELDVSDIAI